MGGGPVWSSGVYTAGVGNTSYQTFGTTQAIKSGKQTNINPLVDPSQPNSAGKWVREAFDNADCQRSTPVAFLFDQTSSMGKLPRDIIKELPVLMGSLHQSGFITGPQIAYGAIGDSVNREMGAFQLGNFEWSNVSDQVLDSLFLEGLGHGNLVEGYDIAMYYMARHVVSDAWNKRSEKGFLFFTGDEFPCNWKHGRNYGDYSSANLDLTIDPDLLKRYIGDPALPKEPVQFLDIIAELKKKWHVFWLYPTEATYYSLHPQIFNFWKNMFGANCIPLEAIEALVPTIIACIGKTVGKSNQIASVLNNHGVTPKLISSAEKSTALVQQSHKLVSGTATGLATSNDAAGDIGGFD